MEGKPVEQRAEELLGPNDVTILDLLGIVENIKRIKTDGYDGLVKQAS